MMRIGIIGCGAIGSALARAIQDQFSCECRLAYVSDINPDQIQKLKRKLKSKRFQAVSADELIRKSDFVIETASMEAARRIVPKALRAGKSILVLSVGGLIQIPNLTRLAAQSKGRLYAASGAIAGIDGVLAANADHIRSVRITTRKPLRNLAASPFFQKYRSRFAKIRKPTLIYEGTAADAVRNFPENINVAATLSLAGIGPKKTKVRLFASPSYRHNMHEIEAEGSFGRIHTQVTNVPSRENPRTSALAIGSAVAILKKMFGRIKIGT